MKTISNLLLQSLFYCYKNLTYEAVVPNLPLWFHFCASYLVMKLSHDHPLCSIIARHVGAKSCCVLFMNLLCNYEYLIMNHRLF